MKESKERWAKNIALTSADLHKAEQALSNAELLWYNGEPLELGNDPFGTPITLRTLSKQVDRTFAVLQEQIAYYIVEQRN